ncbi:hypothetical protein [Brachyspira aalborgi]|uniref:Uncharacterized protein n=1 Tax=Brachyspira aalborgi TaxID=29522 RepID=A0A5C8CIS9_9SPIR|nr:hypothetical protein [Brachyspira aalborgi]TXJ12758.1 hypothetical protein EPJ80_03925 [Brachyspira aalborgi]
MKVIYSFMIGLILFNFYACTKQQIEEPLTENAKLEITYLDEKNNPTEKRTDNILMKLKDDENGFIMVSKKTGENEYTDYLIDTVNNSTISMFYTNKSNFPYKIVVIQEGVSMVGYTSEYREDTKDFDIVWEMLNGSTTEYETFANISATNLFNHAKTSGVDENTDYQIMTLKVSVRIADAINKYVDDNFEDNPITRGFWSKFCNFWKKVFKPIVRVVTIIVAIFIPPVAPIIVSTVKIVDKIIDTINGVYIGVEDAAKAASGKKELLIIKESGGRYKDGEELNLKKANGTEKVILDITEAAINNFVGRATMSGNDINPHDKINFYYSFKDDKNNRNYCVSNTSIFLQPKEALNNGSDINLLITRKFNEIGTNNIYLDFIVPDGVFINRKVKPNFRLVLVP